MDCPCPPACAIDLGWGMQTCRRCGTSKAVQLQNVVNYAVPSPNRAPYSRRKRFVRLLSNTFSARVSRLHKPFLDALTASRPRSVDGIYGFIRASKDRAFKRYDAICLLAFHLLDKKSVPLTLSQLRWAEFAFREIEHRHGRIKGTFPAYSWICERCLQELGRSDLCQFVHKLKCKKRRLVYERLYGDLLRIPAGAL